MSRINIRKYSYKDYFKNTRLIFPPVDIPPIYQLTEAHGKETIIVTASLKQLPGSELMLAFRQRDVQQKK